MTTLEQQLAEAKDMLARIEQQIADAAKPKEWPQHGDSYCRIDGDGDPADLVWTDNFYDLARAAIGNVFRTESEAMQEVERRKVLTELRKLARESWGDAGGPEWCDDSQIKWHLLFDYREKKIVAIQASFLREIGGTYFASEESLKAAINTIGADRLRLLLEV